MVVTLEDWAPTTSGMVESLEALLAANAASKAALVESWTLQLPFFAMKATAAML